MSYIIDIFKLLFSKTRKLKQLKQYTVESMGQSLTELRTRGISQEEKEEIKSFLILSEGEPTECITFYQELVDRLSESRRHKSFLEIRTLSLDLYKLSLKDYKEYYSFRNYLEDNYLHEITTMIHQEAQAISRELDAACLFITKLDDDLVH